MQNFEESFSNYLETYEADELFGSFYSAVRSAYIAGYRAAGGELPKARQIVTLVRQHKTENDLPAR